MWIWPVAEENLIISTGEGMLSSYEFGNKSMKHFVSAFYSAIKKTEVHILIRWSSVQFADQVSWGEETPLHLEEQLVSMYVLSSQTTSISLPLNSQSCKLTDLYPGKNAKLNRPLNSRKTAFQWRITRPFLRTPSHPVAQDSKTQSRQPLQNLHRSLPLWCRNLHRPYLASYLIPKSHILQL
jgi:hypothetical protein